MKNQDFVNEESSKKLIKGMIGIFATYASIGLIAMGLIIQGPGLLGA